MRAGCCHARDPGEAYLLLVRRKHIQLGGVLEEVLALRVHCNLQPSQVFQHGFTMLPVRHLTLHSCKV